jgi:menaquinone-dependent protoporphyrinogen oxidase
MQRFLVAFISQDGQTEKIAHHIARKLEDAGSLVRLIDVGARETEAGADDCDAVIIAGSMQRGRFDAKLSSFIMRHGEALRRCPSAFVSVSLMAASHEPSERAAVDEIVQNFLAELGWKPDEVCHCAGAISDRRLGFIERTALHAVLDGGSDERPVVTEKELTDWVALDGFVRGFAARAASPQP